VTSMNSSPPGATTGGLDWIEEMEPVVGGLLDRHLKVAKEWFPHQYVPWGRGPTSTDRWAGCPGRTLTRHSIPWHARHWC